MKNSTYSTGVLWASIDNLPRSIRFLYNNTFFITAIPGPHEPNSEQLSGLTVPFLDEVRDLEMGKPFSLVCSRRSNVHR